LLFDFPAEEVASTLDVGSAGGVACEREPKNLLNKFMVRIPPSDCADYADKPARNASGQNATELPAVFPRCQY
jgi:hypothetical protein